MRIGRLRFDRVEFAGGLGDLGTFLPLALALIAINGLSFSSVFLMAGLVYVATGIYYGIPVPVQPLKLVTAIAIAAPDRVDPSVLAATALLLGALLLVLAFTGIIDLVARLFTKPVVRGIQLGIGLILMTKGIDLIRREEILLGTAGGAPSLLGVPVNLLLGISAVAAIVLLPRSRRFPAALVVLSAGFTVGILCGALRDVGFQAGPSEIRLARPGWGDFRLACVLLVLPQLPLTLGNAIVGSTDAAKRLLGDGAVTARVSNRNYATGMGMANLAIGSVSGMPICHGAGGIAAHHRFGARTGGATVMLGAVFVVLALVFGRIGLGLVGALPCSILGALLLFAGLELALLVRDVGEKRDLLVTLLIAGTAVATGNMGIAFGSGIALSLLLRLQPPRSRRLP